MKKIKLFLATMIIAVSIFIQTSLASAFSGGDCPKGSMYYNWTHAAELGIDRKDLAKPKGADNASEVMTLADCNLPASSDNYSLMDTITTIINTIVGAVGIIAVAVIVIGGILYATSTGDAAKTKKAQSAILYGIVGLIIAILAFAIVNFILRSIF